MWSKIGTFGLVLILLFSGIGTVLALENPDDTDWKYYEEITIEENTGESFRNYQVLVELDSDNFNFSNADDEGSDIRFYDDGGKEIDFWIEDYEYKNEIAKIWVKVPIIHANDQTDIKLYYGNKKAQSKSDGGATFEFFDDFEGDNLDKSKWKTNAGNVISVENGILYLWEDWTYNQYYLSTDERFRAPLIVEARVKLACRSCGSDLEVGFVETREDYHRHQDAVFVGCDFEDMSGYKFIYHKGNEVVSSTQKITTDEWFNIMIVYLEDKVKFWDSYSGGTQTYMNEMNTPFYLALSGDTDNYKREDSFDWIFVRKYAKNEPTLKFKEDVEKEIQEIVNQENTTSETILLNNTTQKTKSQENMTHEDTFDLINSISTKIDILNRKNMDTTLIETALENAIDAYESEKHNESIELAVNAQKMADDAYDALSEHIEPAELKIDEAKSIGADVSEAEDKLEVAKDALIKGNYDYAKDWADNATELAKNAPIRAIEIENMKALPTKYDQRTMSISGIIRDINAIYGEGYTFALDDGSGMISVAYTGILGDIEDGDKVTVTGVFQASSGDILADDVQSGGRMPGFEVVFAIAGLLAVAYVLRMRK